MRLSSVDKNLKANEMIHLSEMQLQQADVQAAIKQGYLLYETDDTKTLPDGLMRIRCGNTTSNSLAIGSTGLRIAPKAIFDASRDNFLSPEFQAAIKVGAVEVLQAELLSKKEVSEEIDEEEIEEEESQSKSRKKTNKKPNKIKIKSDSKKILQTARAKEIIKENVDLDEADIEDQRSRTKIQITKKKFPGGPNAVMVNPNNDPLVTTETPDIIFVDNPDGGPSDIDFSDDIQKTENTRKRKPDKLSKSVKSVVEQNGEVS